MQSQRLVALNGGIVSYDGEPQLADVNALTEGLQSSNE